ncbi:MAG: GAF domain-containing protein [Bradymonadales bacterium]|nr:MAG: GAF domain-containing protein [Bradymonadales bacterium]
MRSFPVFGPGGVQDLINDLNQEFDSDAGRLLLLDRPLNSEQAAVLQKIENVICFAVPSTYWQKSLHSEASDQSFSESLKSDSPVWPDYIQGLVPEPEDPLQLSWALEEAKRIFDLRFEVQQARHQLSVQRQRLEEVMNSSVELAEEHDFKKLCEKALSRMRRLTGAEGASLYIIDHEEKKIRFVALQNEKTGSTWEQKVLPLDKNSFVGSAALQGKIVFVPEMPSAGRKRGKSSKFSRAFDRENDFETRSLLSIPLVKSDDEVVGVIQLVNCQSNEVTKGDYLKLVQSFSNHVGAALERVLLNQSIEELFEGFIRASVTAIEARDPTTSGHSERVAKLCLHLARAVHESKQPAFKTYSFDEQQLKELRYASLLHDFGKIAVPESVLVKEKKLFPHQLEILRLRIELFKNRSPEMAKDFEGLWANILQANEPTVLPEEIGLQLERYLEFETQLDGQRLRLLEPEEMEQLRVPKGSLSPQERLKIQSHVEYSYQFLAQIPWTKPLSRVAEIAGSHHEKLNGKGYPHRLKAEQIPFESQIMAVTDVFDALTAMDRPYKKAVPLEKAIEILRMEAQEFALNPDLVQLFEQQRIYKAIKTIDMLDLDWASKKF